MTITKIHAALISTLLMAIFSAAPTTKSPPPGSWIHPLSSDAAVLEHFDPPQQKWDAGHRGVDFALPAQLLEEGTVQAPSSGVVHFVGVVVDRPVVSINHGNGYISSYEPVESELSAGDVISAGDAIGTIGQYQNQPHCTQVCLHFGVRLNGEYINPLPLLAQYQPSVLLPLAANAMTY